jgi:hypothetical protein
MAHVRHWYSGGAGVVGMSDLIAGYLNKLRAGLRTPEADRVLAEAEDHLRETRVQ